MDVLSRNVCSEQNEDDKRMGKGKERARERQRERTQKEDENECAQFFNKKLFFFFFQQEEIDIESSRRFAIAEESTERGNVCACICVGNTCAGVRVHAYGQKCAG